MSARFRRAIHFSDLQLGSAVDEGPEQFHGIGQGGVVVEWRAPERAHRCSGRRQR